MIYDQGFEVKTSNQTYFSFFKYKKNGNYVTNYCGRAINGWYSDNDSNNNFGCYFAKKINSKEKKTTLTYTASKGKMDRNKKFKNELELINLINKEQPHWKAEPYKRYEKRTVKEMMKRAGGKKQKFPRNPNQFIQFSDELLLNSKKENIVLPENFDWRNVSGENYVSPIRAQGYCGSCYVFATIAALESRIRIQTKNKFKPILSPQDIVSCSHYSQKCHGGFPYLAGKYGKDYYVVPEDCFKYQGSDSVNCSQKCTNPKFKVRVTDYQYIGGYYGKSNERLMV